MNELTGRAAIVTGGGRGIGRSIAIALAQAGADVAINYRRDEAAAQAVSKAIAALGRKCLVEKADVTDEAVMKAFVERTAATLGKLDVVISNAGIASRGNTLADTDPAEMRRIIDTHVFGAFHLLKHAVPHLRKNKRSDFIFISSLSPHIAPPGHGPYAAAKAALEAMSSVLAKEELKHGMRVNTIAATVVDTDLGKRLVKYNLGDEIEKVQAQFPFGRVCQPEDVANLCVFLASDKASYISGHTIFLDGADPIGVAKKE
jgi:NAD(P)-dependent dehydrogenase (short-subunit alcohol dehydrogenase family)